jgi:hypothetical protein
MSRPRLSPALLLLLFGLVALTAAWKHPVLVHPTPPPPAPLFTFPGSSVQEVHSSEELHALLATDAAFLVCFYSDRTSKRVHCDCAYFLHVFVFCKLPRVS